MAATAGKRVRLKASGAPVAFVLDAASNTGDNRTYQITNGVKRVWDRATPIEVYYGGVLQAASLYVVNRLAGLVVFNAAQGASNVTISGAYLPMSTIAEARSFTVSAKATTVEDTAFGDTEITRVLAQRDCSGTLGQWWVDNAFQALLVAQAILVVEIAIGDGATPLARAWAFLTERSHEIVAGGLQDEPLTWEGSADADGRAFAFLL